MEKEKCSCGDDSSTTNLCLGAERTVAIGKIGKGGSTPQVEAESAGFDHSGKTGVSTEPITHPLGIVKSS